jgi:hypothetical protein
LKFFQNSAVRKVFGLRREKVIVFWKKFSKEDFPDLTPC